MSDKNDELNSHLERAFQKRDEAAEKLPIKADVEVIEPTDENADEIKEEKLGLIRKLQLRNSESAHELQKRR